MKIKLLETKENPEAFDIFKINFIYQEDLLSKNPRSKQRPALIIKVENTTILPFEFAMITSKKSGSNDYEILDWKEAGLKAPSYIRFLRKVAFNKQVLENAEYYGKLTERDINKIKSLKLV